MFKKKTLTGKTRSSLKKKKTVYLKFTLLLHAEIHFLWFGGKKCGGTNEAAVSHQTGCIIHWQHWGPSLRARGGARRH